MTRSDGAATLSDVLERTARILREAGIEDAAAEARWLVCEAAGVRPIDLLVRADAAIDGSEAERIAAFAARRANSEPLSRILGKREFYGRDFQLSPATLDPRADTETLVDLALQVAQEPARKGRPLRLLDVGTGTGAILVSLLAELPAATGLGIDVSADAVATAKTNALRHGVAARATFECRDLRAGLAGRYDLIVSNPPYIRTADIPGLAPEVRQFDPHLALDGGADGLVFYRLLANFLGNLEPGGWMLLEVGAGQADDVAGILLQSRPDGIVRMAEDLGGHLRVVAIGSQGTVVG